VWVFDRRGEPVRRIRCVEGYRPTNVAYVAELDVPGLPLFSHQS
jgi:hypothetical protein